MTTKPDIFDKIRIPPALDEHLRATNPWWLGKPGRVLPPYRRWPFNELLERLESGVAPAVVLRGARQVGKTTLQEQAIVHLLDKGVAARRILRVQFDEISSILRGVRDPILAVSRWFENRVLEQTLNEAAHAGERAYIFLDEVQNLRDWAPQIKALVDLNTVSVVVTGSSALRIEEGRDSLAGRITSLELGTLLMREIAGIRSGGDLKPLLKPGDGLHNLVDVDFWRELARHEVANRELRNKSFAHFSERGGYPFAHALPDISWPQIASQLNENVIERVIQHDLRMGEHGRKRDPQLLEEVFRLACRYAGQAPGRAIFVSEIQQVLQANVGWQRILSYLRFLDGALLISLIRPLEIRLKRRKGNAKICLVDPGLRSSWLQEKIPLDPDALKGVGHLRDLAGHLAESVAGSFLSTIPGLEVAHFPERSTEPEVDFILTVGERRVPVEVKYCYRVEPLRDTVGLRSFLEKTHYNAPFGILVTEQDHVSIPDPRIVPIPLRSLLLLR